jgi:hypothetical protein
LSGTDIAIDSATSSKITVNTDVEQSTSIKIRMAYDGTDYDTNAFTVAVIKTPLSVNTITSYSEYVQSSTTDVATLTSAHDSATHTVTYALLDASASDSTYTGTKVTISSGKVVVADTSSKFSESLKI